MDGSTSLAIDARRDLDSLTTLIDESGPVLNSQVDSSDSIAAWARNVANLADQVKNHDSDVRKFLDRGAGAADQGRALFDRVNPTLPVLLANLVSVGEVALTYNAGIEQILVVLPASVASLQAAGIANRDTRQDYKGAYLDFNLNLNLPPPATPAISRCSNAARRHIPMRRTCPRATSTVGCRRIPRCWRCVGLETSRVSTLLGSALRPRSSVRATSSTCRSTRG